VRCKLYEDPDSSGTPQARPWECGDTSPKFGGDVYLSAISQKAYAVDLSFRLR
jgi:hypothetical protein